MMSLNNANGMRHHILEKTIAELKQFKYFNDLQNERAEDDIIKRDKFEFYKRKMIKISNVTGAILTMSNMELLQRLESSLPNTTIETVEINGNMGYIAFKDPHQSYSVIKSFPTVTLESETYSLSYMTPDAMLFFGNLPLTYQTKELAKLASSYGVITRCLVIHSKMTKKSKGYGFVEYASRNHAMQAKLHLGAKYLEGRSLRVDWSDERMRDYEDTHATTLFVDKLPRHFLQDNVLTAMFQKHGKVIFCQIATSSSTGISRGFAFVDMAGAIDAENAMNACNNAVIDGTQVRVSYAMPGRPGASILHPKRTDNIGSLLTSFGMTQLPLLNFAQLLAAHGAPLMPAQLSALMSALQNYNEPTPRLGGAVCEQTQHCIITGQDSNSPNSHSQQYRHTIEDSNEDYTNETEYPLVYQNDAKYYSSTDIQEYEYESCEDNEDDAQTFQNSISNEWSSQNYSLSNYFDETCFIRDSDNKSYFAPQDDEYTLESKLAVDSPINDALNTKLQSLLKPPISLIKKQQAANTNAFSVWGQHDQGIMTHDILKRISTSNPIHE